MKNKLNRLAQASSPYLQQHAGNPVDWFPWGEEALLKARTEHKPLLISIGYAACHWCHVMAHESFMDSEVAAFMNSHFVCIKIDREERPDIDQVYMDAVQHITGGGGWPLHAFALPDGRPFHGGTYFPKDQWLELLKRIQTVYESHFTDLETQADTLTSAIRTSPFMEAESTEEPDISSILYSGLFDNWEQYIDHHDGGFARSPKFPMPGVWEFLLQYNYFTGNQKALEYVKGTLNGMAKGGIYDQAGGGFSRYSTDRFWKVPHFEKMLYDNAQLISLYAHAYQVTREPGYAGIVKESLLFMERELMNPVGAFYSSLDADSEGEEGKFYTFTMEEFKQALDPAIVTLMAEYYQVTADGNWEGGRNILHRNASIPDFARSHQMTTEAFEVLLRQANTGLMKARELRTRPARDEKIITSWNALMIIAYVDAYHALGNAVYLNGALRLAAFVEHHMISGEGHVYRSYRDGNVTIDAFLDDYALLAAALIKLYETTFTMHWLELGHQLVRFVMDHFADPAGSLFFYTSDLSESLIARKYEIPDTVIPSSNSVMAHVFIRLGYLYDNPSYLSKARAILKQIKNNLTANSPYFAGYAMAMGLLVYHPVEIAILGSQALKKNSTLHTNYLPDALFSGGEQENLPLLNNKLVAGATRIYVCKNKTCKLPVEDEETALKLILDPHGTEIG
jgi:uncharacterized protein